MSSASHGKLRCDFLLITAIWRLLNFELSGRERAVTRLSLHVARDQLVLFTDNQHLWRAIERGLAKWSTLTKFFRLCQENVRIRSTGASVQTLKYGEVSEHFWWDKSFKNLKPCTNMNPEVGRVYFEASNQGE